MIENDDKPLQTRLPPRDLWGPLAPFTPVGTCKLSSSYDWPFDLHNSKEAVIWAVSRVFERSTLQSLPHGAALARFPHQAETSQPQQMVFGPFNEVGLVLSLQHCDGLRPDTSRLSVSRRSRWLHYVLRECGPLPVMHFPPLNHVVGTMVEHREFTDEVAMGVYGVFDDCTIDVLVEGGLLPAFGVAPSKTCKALTSVTSGAVRLNSLNGATVLFLACLLLQAEDPVQKLLNMKVTGLVILTDLADHGLGWVIQSRDASAIISRWIGSTEYCQQLPPPAPRLFLLFEAWLRRLDGPFSHPHEATPVTLFRDLCDLNLSAHTGSSRPGDGDPDGSRDEKRRRNLVRSGMFHGAGAGSAVAVFLGSFADKHRENTPTDAVTFLAKEWLDDLMKRLVKYGGPSLITVEAAAAAKVHLTSKLEACTEEGLEELVKLDEENRRSLKQFKSSIADFNADVFLHHFHRAFLVSVTGGRIHDGGVGPLTWSPHSLRRRLHFDRRLLLGYPPLDTAEPPNFTLPWRRALLGVAVFSLVLWALLRPSSLPRLGGHPGLSLALARDEACLSQGWLRSSFQASDTLFMTKEEKVCILDTPVEGWYKIENLNGEVGVSTSDHRHY